ANNPTRTTIWASWVFNVIGRIGAEPVLGPLPDVAVHVIQPPSVSRELPDRRCLLPIAAFLAPSVGVLAVVVGLLRRDRLAEIERRRRASTARIFPLRLCRHAERLARQLL